MKELDPFVKIVVVGDPFVGKTWFLSTFVYNKLPENCGPTLFDNLSTQFVFDGIEYELSLWDTPGAPERKKLRCISYQNVDVFVICYAIDNRASFENVKYKWLPELRRRSPGVPRILVGLKSDLRNKVPNTVTEQDGEYMQYDIQAHAFFEYSISFPKKLTNIFTEVIRAGLHKKRHFKKNSCSIQ